jgi:hypothetical protein
VLQECIVSSLPVTGTVLGCRRCLQERASVKGKSLQQLGDWQQPLSAAHEVSLNTAEVVDCTYVRICLPNVSRSVPAQHNGTCAPCSSYNCQLDGCRRSEVAVTSCSQAACLSNFFWSQALVI